MAGGVIRTANVTDLNRILAIYNEAILTTTAVYDYEPHTLSMRRQWFEQKQAANLPVFVAEVDGTVAGFSSIGPFRAWAAYQYTVENSVYVASRYRGKGVGQQLLAATIEAARQLEFHAIVAGIDAENVASIRLHEKFGFWEVAHFQQVGYKFERWLDLKFLQLILHG